VLCAVGVDVDAFDDRPVLGILGRAPAVAAWTTHFMILGAGRVVAALGGLWWGEDNG
jgi:hypothetical protein